MYVTQTHKVSGRWTDASDDDAQPALQCETPAKLCRTNICHVWVELSDGGSYLPKHDFGRFAALCGRRLTQTL